MTIDSDTEIILICCYTRRGVEQLHLGAMCGVGLQHATHIPATQLTARLLSLPLGGRLRAVVRQPVSPPVV